MGWEDEDEEGRKRYESREVAGRKAKVGMAIPGSDQYKKNAKYILSTYLKPNKETREKLRDLTEEDY